MTKNYTIINTQMSEIDNEEAPHLEESQPMEEDAQEEEAMQVQDQQPEEEEQAEQQYYDDPYYDDDAYYDDLNQLHSTLSKDKPYCICKLEELSRKIWQDVEKQDQKCCMSQGWTLMLYAFTNFNEMYLADLLDQEGTGKSIIKYDEDYRAPGRIQGECGVCLVEKELLVNPCGHAFCGECWHMLVGLNWTDRNIYELFPLCPQEGCYHRTNYHLMEALWEQDPTLKANFQRLLCLKYSQQSLQARLCPNQTCGKAFFINPQTIIDSILTCECGTEVCRHCGSQAHWPLECLDLRSWSSLVSGRQDQWINGLVVQKCPMCRETIEKNNGCIHMTCRCKYQFCWICLKVWKGHGNYYACSDISRDDHQKKLKEEQEKKKLDENLYNQRLEETKGETDRLKLSIKRVNEMVLDGLVKRLEQAQVFAIHSELLNQMRDFIRRAWALAYRCAIFTFFEGERSTPLRRVVYRLNQAANAMDDYLSDSLKGKFKQMDDKIQARVSRKEGEEGQITTAQRINLRLQFMKDREGFSFMIREGLKVIDQVKKGEIDAALQELLINVKNPLYVEKQPLSLQGKKPSLPIVEQSQRESE